MGFKTITYIYLKNKHSHILYFHKLSGLYYYIECGVQTADFWIETDKNRYKNIYATNREPPPFFIGRLKPITLRRDRCYVQSVKTYPQKPHLSGVRSPLIFIMWGGQQWLKLKVPSLPFGYGTLEMSPGVVINSKVW